MSTRPSSRSPARLALGLLSALAVTLPTTAVLTTTRAVLNPRPAVTVPDGLALTPPMGFNNWNTTGCRPVFNEAMVKSIADLFVSSGLKDAGYKYVNLDDCWALPARGPDGDLVPDPARFPSGIKALADYVHAKGLKFGIYTSAGTRTCNRLGFPGALDHEYQDATLFASWEVDYVKYDNCNNQGRDAIERYTRMRDALEATGRPMVYAICEWGQNQPWNWAPGVGHLWRTTGDIRDNWGSVRSIIRRNLSLARYAQPGAWNDPDMLEVGNGGMTDVEYRSHFSMWAIMAAPLLIGSDLRQATPQTMEILLNRDVIAVDQDPLGVQGRPVWSLHGRHVVAKPLRNGDVAVALYNETDQPGTIATTAAAIGLPPAAAYKLRDLWAHTDRETTGAIRAHVPAHGTAIFRVGAHDPQPLPPAVDLAITAPAPFPGGRAIVTAGDSTTVKTTITNSGRSPLLLPRAGLAGPPGWSVRPTTTAQRSTLPGGSSFTTTWQVSPPAGVATGSYELTGTMRYYPPGRNSPDTGRIVTTVAVPPPVPTGVAQLGDLTWLTADNAFGPVERNTSNGEARAGDGRPITIGGVVFAKGLGVHALSTVEFYLGRGCTTFGAFLGLDDETGNNGSVVFEVYADGREIGRSGVLTGSMPAMNLTADVSGTTLLTLVVSDADDGITADHADWADAKVTCA